MNPEVVYERTADVIGQAVAQMGRLIAASDESAEEAHVAADNLLLDVIGFLAADPACGRVKHELLDIRRRYALVKKWYS